MTKCYICEKEINIFEHNYTSITCSDHIHKIKNKKLNEPYSVYGEVFYVCQKCKNKYLRGLKNEN